MVKEWQFVSNQAEDGAGKDEKTRKIVRKAAMKAFRKNQRLERTRKFMQKNGEQPELRTLDYGAGKEASRDFEQPGLLAIRQDSDSGDLSADLRTSVGVLQPQDWYNFEVVTSFSWPQEIVSLDPFGSSPLGTCATWHELFMHCKYYKSVVSSRDITPWDLGHQPKTVEMSLRDKLIADRSNSCV